MNVLCVVSWDDYVKFFWTVFSSIRETLIMLIFSNIFSRMLRIASAVNSN